MPISPSAIFVTGETKPAHVWKKKRPFATVALKPISKNLARSNVKLVIYIDVFNIR